MDLLRYEQKFMFENSDGDVDGHSTTPVSAITTSVKWFHLIRLKYGIIRPDLYVVDSTKKLIPPHCTSLESKTKPFTLHKGLLLFHTTIHEPGLNFKYPVREPFFSTTPSHGLGIAFEEKRQLVSQKGHVARMMIFILKKDLVAVDNCGDCVRSNLGEDAAVAGYVESNKAFYNLNEIRIFKKTEQEIAECVDYVTEFDLTEFILTNNPYTKYTYYDSLELFRNRDVIVNFPIAGKFYEISGWKPVTSQLSALWFMADLLNDSTVPLWFTLSLFAVNQMWYRETPDDSDLAMVIMYDGTPKLVFRTDFVEWDDPEDNIPYRAPQKMLREELEKYFA